MQGSNIVKAESPVWNQRELILSDPVHIAKFEDDHEAAVNFYYKQVNKLFSANTVLGTQLRSALEEKRALAELIASLEKGEKNSQEEKKKRHRRCANEIERKYVCPVRKCEKSYGTEGSMAQHMKLKHPDISYTPEMCQRDSQVLMAKVKYQQQNDIVN